MGDNLEDKIEEIREERDGAERKQNGCLWKQAEQAVTLWDLSSLDRDLVLCLDSG